MTTRYIYTEDGLLLKQTITQTIVPGKFENVLLQRKLKDCLMMTPCLARLEKPTGHVHLLVSPGNPVDYAVISLTAINFRCGWDCVDGVLAPKMESNGACRSPINPVEEMTELLWKIPANLPTFLIADTLGKRMGFATAIITDGEVQWRQLPVPNLYDTGWFCFEPPEGSRLPMPVIDRAAALYHHWVNSVWNSDLYRRNFESTFKWDKAGKQLEVPDLADKLNDTKPWAAELKRAFPAIEAYLLKKKGA